MGVCKENHARSQRLAQGQSQRCYFVFYFYVVVVMVVVVNVEYLVLVCQYRPTVDSFSWEMPAGLFDSAEESVEEAARRELLEETGFVFNVIDSISPAPVPCDLGMSDVGMYVVEGRALISTRDPILRDPRDAKLIETRMVPLRSLYSFLNDRLCEGDSVDSHLYQYAQGLRTALRYLSRK